MKKITYLFYFLLCFNLINAQTGIWSSITSSTTIKFNSVSLISPANIIAVGDSGNVLRTDDGGFNWQNIQLPTVTSLVDVKFLGTTGFIITNQEANTGLCSIYKSTDKGKTWFRKFYSYSNSLVSLSIINTQKIIVLKSNGNILLSIDGGETWIENQTNLNSYYYDLYFTDNNVGFMVGSNGKIAKSIDGGNNWSLKTTNITESLFHVFKDNNVLFATGIGIILKSTDDGETWIKLNVDPKLNNQQVLKLKSVSPNLTFIITNNKVYETYNEGISVEEKHEFNEVQSNVQFFDKYYAFSVGINGSCFRYLAREAFNAWVPITVNSNNVLQDLSFPSYKIGYAVGYQATILKTEDAGLNWGKLPVSGAALLTGVHFTSDSVGYICDYLGVIAKTNNAGLNWQTLYDGGVSAGFTDITFINDSTGFVIGNNGTILKTTNYGFSWSASSSGTSAFLKQIQILNDGTLKIVGEQGKILTSYDNGNTWKTSNAPWDSYQALYYLNKNRGFIGGSFGFLRFTENADTNWSVVFGSSSYNIKQIVFTDSLNGYVLYDNQNDGASYVAKSVDGGISWNSIKIDPLGGMNGLLFTDKLSGFICGSNTTSKIYKTFMGGVTDVADPYFNDDLAISNFGLEQNYPNPFNPSTKIDFVINKPDNITLIVYDLLGKEIATLINSYLSSGSYSITFNAQNLSSGIYFYSLKSNNLKITKKMLLIK